jgi:Spy/CpxP family protein refolding chaperone
MNEKSPSIGGFRGRSKIFCSYYFFAKTLEVYTMSIRSTTLFTILFSMTIGSNIAFANPIKSSSPSVEPNLIAQSNRRLIRKGEGRDELMKQLNLNSQQQQQLTAIRQKYQGQMKQLHEQLRTNQEALRTMMSGTASEDSIRAKHTEIVKLRQQLENLGFESMLESRAILTPDQRKQFAQLMEKQRGKMKSKRGNSMGNPGDKPPAF